MLCYSSWWLFLIYLKMFLRHCQTNIFHWHCWRIVQLFIWYLFIIILGISTLFKLLRSWVNYLVIENHHSNIQCTILKIWCSGGSHSNIKRNARPSSKYYQWNQLKISAMFWPLLPPKKVVIDFEQKREICLWLFYWHKKI